MFQIDIEVWWETIAVKNSAHGNDNDDITLTALSVTRNSTLEP